MVYQIAIIGAGFSGLATAWYLLQNPKVRVSIYDPLGPGGGTSGIASGLLHVFAGAKSPLNRNGYEGLAATLNLLEISSTFCKRSVYKKTGMFRPAISNDQIKNFQKCTDQFAEVDWWDAQLAARQVPFLPALSGIFIHPTYVVDCASYLTGLWKACEKLKANFQRQRIQQLEELQSFDTVVIAAGAESLTFGNFPLTPIKGQILEFESNGLTIPFPINSHAYLIQENLNQFLAGATFERDFSSNQVDLGKAKDEIIPKIRAFYPAIDDLKITHCRAGLRASGPAHLPYIKRLSNRCWILSGMGSKGLLYHALYAKKLAEDVLTHLP